MADPYFQIAFDTKRRIGLVSKALDQPHPGTAGSGLLELLEDVWRRKDPAVSSMTLAACFGPDPRVPAALVAFGFLVVAGEAWELCAEETDRLLSTHRQRVAAGKARAAAAGREGGAFTSGPPAADQRATSGGPAGLPAADQLLQPAANSQQPTAKKKKLAGPAPADPRTPVTNNSGAEGKLKRPVTTPQDPREGGDATYKALVAALFVLFQEHKGGVGYDPSGKDWAALADLRKRHDGSEIIRRWAIGLQARYGARCATFWALRERWNDCAQPETQGGAQGPQKRQDPNQGIMTRDGGPVESPEEIEAANRRSEAFINGG